MNTIQCLLLEKQRKVNNNFCKVALNCCKKNRFLVCKGKRNRMLIVFRIDLKIVKLQISYAPIAVCKYSV